MIYFMLIISVFLAVFKSSVYNSYAKREGGQVAGIFAFNAFTYGIAAILAFVFGIGNSLSKETAFCAIGYAVVVFSLQALSVAAMSVGQMSTTSLFVLYGMIIPSLAGPVFWKEPFGVFQGIGIILILVSIWLLRDKNSENKKAGKKWSVLITVCFLLSGFAGLVEKIHQSTPGKDERLMLLFVAYVLMFVFSLVGYNAVRKKKSDGKISKVTFIHGLINGIVVIFYSQINLTLAGKLDSLIYYPVANGGALLLTVFISATVFKEKLSKIRVAGFGIGLISIILLSLPVV